MKAKRLRWGSTLVAAVLAYQVAACGSSSSSGGGGSGSEVTPIVAEETVVAAFDLNLALLSTLFASLGSSSISSSDISASASTTSITVSGLIGGVCSGNLVGEFLQTGGLGEASLTCDAFNDTILTTGSEYILTGVVENTLELTFTSESEFTYQATQSGEDVTIIIAGVTYVITFATSADLTGTIDNSDPERSVAHTQMTIDGTVNDVPVLIECTADVTSDAMVVDFACTGID